jgi:hypothetical protein
MASMLPQRHYGTGEKRSDCEQVKGKEVDMHCGRRARRRQIAAAAAFYAETSERRAVDPGWSGMEMDLLSSALLACCIQHTMNEAVFDACPQPVSNRTRSACVSGLDAWARPSFACRKSRLALDADENFIISECLIVRPARLPALNHGAHKPPRPTQLNATQKVAKRRDSLASLLGRVCYAEFADLCDLKRVGQLAWRHSVAADLFSEDYTRASA